MLFECLWSIALEQVAITFELLEGFKTFFTLVAKMVLIKVGQCMILHLFVWLDFFLIESP